MRVLLKAWMVYLVVLALYLSAGENASAWEIDESASVRQVIDGELLDASPVGTVRLADINAPDVGEPGYVAARDGLSSMVLNQQVFFDVDDLNRTDILGRLVCVVYVRHNATHLRNVNQALIDLGLADLVDFVNEFDPTTWTLYVYHPESAGPSGTFDILWPTVAVATVAGIGLAYVLVRPRKRRPS